MTPISILLKRAGHTLKSNSPAILTALGVSGTITTAYLANRAGYKHAQRVGEEAPKLSSREEFDLVWRVYVPTAVSGAVTIGCIIGAARVGSRRTAALTAAYSISEKAFAEYKDKVVEKIGERKEQEIRDEIAQERVKENSPGVIVAGSGSVLCHEHHTGRYFMSDMESLRKAQNDINAKLLSEMRASLSDFYYMVGLPWTSYSSEMGWDSDVLLALHFSTVLSDDNRPCLSFEYNYLKPVY